MPTWPLRTLFAVMLVSASLNALAGDEELAVLDFDFESELSAEQNFDGSLAMVGPTDQTFEGLPQRNQALSLTKAGAHLRIADDQEAGPLDLNNGDAFTIEAWVKVDRIGRDANVYVIGKGRTYENGVVENQNYALRLREVGGEARVSFLFATHSSEGNNTYHRWTSSNGFASNDKQWHHIAVSYEFGNSKSMKGYVDGATVKGTWDMGGATEKPPVNDNDSVWIGSSRGGDPNNSFVGWLDDVRLERKILSSNLIASRYKVRPQIPTWPATADSKQVTVTLHPASGSHTQFPLTIPAEAMRFTAEKLALHRLPLCYSAGGIRDAWKGPVLLRAFAESELPTGEVEILLRSPGRARVWLNGEIVLETPARRLNPDAHQPFVTYKTDLPWLREPRVGDAEVRKIVRVTNPKSQFILESLVGSATTRCELGETLVAFRTGDQIFSLVGPSEDISSGNVALVDREFESYRSRLDEQLTNLDRQLLIESAAGENDFWAKRHALAKQVLAKLPALEKPGLDKLLREKLELGGVDPKSDIDQLVLAKLDESAMGLASEQKLFEELSDAEFLRRLNLDLLGIPPTVSELTAFIQDSSANKYAATVDRLLANDRWADHWTSYWQDVLAENPNILKPSLNNSGPFRFWIHDALLVNKPLDRFVTELIRMEGNLHAGGAAGFGLAADNDVPMAEKAHTLTSAFLAIDMKCARCHDSPYHPWTQKDLFGLAAMLDRKPIKVPVTSSVPKAFFDRKGEGSPVRLSIQPGDEIEPGWSFEQVVASELTAAEGQTLLGRRDDPRERLAVLITRGENQRFPQVIVNRVWTRLFGWGLVSSVDDWHEIEPRNSQLLQFLGRQLVESNYDLKALVRSIVLTDIYRRRSIEGSQMTPDVAYLAAWHRRMTAEQLVDSIHFVAGVELDTEAITFDPEASQNTVNFLNLGPAHRAWQLTSLSNERDRPSLSLPKAAAVVECLEAFGWRSARQAPTSHRETEPNMVQPGVVANGNLSTRATRFTDESELTSEALRAETVEQFVDRLFLRALSRQPSKEERQTYVDNLRDGFSSRFVNVDPSEKSPKPHRGFVTWSNHFDVKANELMRQIEDEVASGPVPTDRLKTDWRERAEDAAWALLNSPEFQFLP